MQPQEPHELVFGDFDLSKALAHCAEAGRLVCEAVGAARDEGDASPTLDLIAVICGNYGWPRLLDVV
ncbi:MAG: hypothetical protein M0004_10640 [Actinomycetota bacterium]|nr:hypothetical protein [Actinomycetota bacterium]